MRENEIQDRGTWLTPSSKTSAVIVTGAGSGIGYATTRTNGKARSWAWNNVSGMRQAPPATSTETSRRCEPLVFDVTDSHSASIRPSTRWLLGTVLDVVVDNAGMLQSVPGHGERRATMMAKHAAGQPGGSLGVTVNTSDTLWREHMAVMLDGVFYGTRAALRHMEAQGFGAIVNTASVARSTLPPTIPSTPRPRRASLPSHAFGGARGRRRRYPRERRCSGFDGDRSRSWSVPIPARSSSRNASGRIAQPEGIAEAFAFLASDRASYCFGNPHRQWSVGLRGGWLGLTRPPSTSRVDDGGEQCSLGGGPRLQFTAEDLDADDGVGMVGHQPLRPLDER